MVYLRGPRPKIKSRLPSLCTARVIVDSAALRLFSVSDSSVIAGMVSDKNGAEALRTKIASNSR